MPTGQQYSSVATQAQLTGNISNSVTSCAVNTTSGFPATPFTGVLDIGTATQEIVDVTNIAGLTLTITRSVDGSAGQAHSTGATFTHSAIARDFREARSHMDTGTASSPVPIHGLAIGSSVVGTTDSQTLTNKTLTSPTINSPTVTNLTANNPTITGTVAGGASYSAINLTGTVGGSPTITTPVLQNPIVTTSAIGQVPIKVNALAGVTADLQQWQVNSATVAKVIASGIITNPAVAPSGLTGAQTASRYVGATAGGPPVSGTFVAGDWVNDTVNGIFWVCVTGGTPGTWNGSGMALIKAVALVAPASSVSFSSIPQYFRHLRLEWSAQPSDAVNNEDIRIQINGVSTASYSTRTLTLVNSTTPAAGGGSAATSGIIGPMSGNGSANDFGSGVVDFPYYSDGTKNRTWVFSGTSIVGTGGSVWQPEFGGGQLNSATAMSSFTLTTANASNFVTGSSFSLYGIA